MLHQNILQQHLPTA